MMPIFIVLGILFTPDGTKVLDRYEKQVDTLEQCQAATKASRLADGKLVLIGCVVLQPV